MMKVRNLGRKSLEEVKVKLADLGLGLKTINKARKTWLTVNQDALAHNKGQKS